MRLKLQLLLEVPEGTVREGLRVGGMWFDDKARAGGLPPMQMADAD